MILIEGTPLYCFEPRMHFTNTRLNYDDRYTYLDRALIRSKVGRDGHNYLIGEKAPALKTEYMQFKNNLLIVDIDKNEMSFFVILEGRILAVTNDFEDTNIRNFFKTKCFSVIDSCGKQLLIKSYEDFVKIINVVKESQNKFDYKLEQYHKHMDSLFELRRKREESFCCSISECFDKLVALSDEIGKEMCDALAAYHDSEENNIVEKHIYRYKEDEKLCVIFGLYLACLRAYNLNYDGDPLSLDERIHIGFMKEFNYFLAQNEGAVDRYADYFNLRKIEIDNIKQLLKEEGLTNLSEWCEPVEIKIL